jgi:hypothetical protein
MVDSLAMAWVEISEMLDSPFSLRIHNTRQRGTSRSIFFSSRSMFWCSGHAHGPASKKEVFLAKLIAGRIVMAVACVLEVLIASLRAEIVATHLTFPCIWLLQRCAQVLEYSVDISSIWQGLIQRAV